MRDDGNARKTEAERNDGNARSRETEGERENDGNARVTARKRGNDDRHVQGEEREARKDEREAEREKRREREKERKKEEEKEANICIVMSRVRKDKQSVAERASAHCIRVRDPVDASSPRPHPRAPVCTTLHRTSATKRGRSFSRVYPTNAHRDILAGL